MAQTNYHLHLKGYVGGYDFDASYVDYVLANNKDKPVHVLIDSLGGSLATALSIASAFANHGNVSVHFAGMNASAATIASLGAKHVSMDASAMYLAHKCSTEFFKWKSLNADQLDDLIAECKQMKSDLNKIDSNVAQMYARKCKKASKDLLSLMKVGGWLSAEEAKEWGFVDEITHFEYEQAPVLTDAVASAMASAGIPIPQMAMHDKSSPMVNFFNALAGFFKSSTPQAAAAQPQQAAPAAKTVSDFHAENLETILAISAFEKSDNGFCFTAEQLQTLETQLASNKTRIEDLQNQVDILNKKPGDTSHSVVNTDGGTSAENTVEEEYVNTLNEAKNLFSKVP